MFQDGNAHFKDIEMEGGCAWVGLTNRIKHKAQKLAQPHSKT